MEKEIIDFLNFKGFKTIQSNQSSSFGEYYNVLSNGIIKFRFVKSRSGETIDIQKIGLNEQWYDIALVKALLHGKDKAGLDKPLSLEGYIAFLQDEFMPILVLFNDSNYLATKERLTALGNERAQRMFPGIE